MKGKIHRMSASQHTLRLLRCLLTSEYVFTLYTCVKNKQLAIKQATTLHHLNIIYVIKYKMYKN